MGRLRGIVVSLLGLAWGAMAHAQLPPALAQLAAPISIDEIHSLGEFVELEERIAAAEARPRGGMLAGFNRAVNIGVTDQRSQPLNNGNQLYRVAVRSPEALSTSLHFSVFELPEDAKLWLYAPNSDSALGPFSSDHANAVGEFWSPLVVGDTIVVEVETANGSVPNVQIAQINHGVKNWWAESGQVQSKAAGACHINVACSAADNHTTKVRATARITYSEGNSSFLCSGSLLNNSSQDGTPYFLTANHCVSSEAVANSVTSYWQYESNSCSSNTPPSVLFQQTISGASLVATWATNDFTLLELDRTPPSSYNPYWSGWDRSGEDLGSGVGVHHPQGDVKKISFENNAMSVVNGSANPQDATNFLGRYVRVSRWDAGTTEGGSSGSGIWSPSNRVVGQLSAGSADCDTPNGQDFYGWIGQAWDGGGTPTSRLKDWLAPGDNAIQTLEGCDHHRENCSGGGSTATPRGTTGDNSGGGGTGSVLLILAGLLLWLKTGIRSKKTTS